MKNSCCELLCKVLAIGLLLLFASSCNDDDTKMMTTTPPEIELKPVSTGISKFSFILQTDVDGEYGYEVVKRTENEEMQRPAASSLFGKHVGTVKRKVEVTADGLDAGTSYVLYAAVRVGSVYSDVEALEFETESDTNKNKYIAMTEIGFDRFSFTVNYDGSYLFVPVPAANLNLMTAAECLVSYGCAASGNAEYHWVNGGEHVADNGTFPMTVIADMSYIILMAPCNASYDIVGEIQQLSFKTKPRQGSETVVEVKCSEITSMSVKVETRPGEGVAEYYVYVREKDWYTDIIENNGGEAMAIHLIKYAADSGLSKKYESWATEVWENLKPSKEYYCGVVSVDFSGGENLQLVPFTTDVSSGRLPDLRVKARKSAAKPTEMIDMNLQCDIAYLVRYVVLPAGEVKFFESQGKGDKEIISEAGIDLNIEDVEQVNTSEGYNIEVENLYPGLEYVCIAAARSTEEEETYVRTLVTLDDWPAEVRVESDLFDKLPGTWKISYSYLDYNDMPQEIKDVEVKIEAGVDDKTCREYRARNMLVLTEYPFQQGDNKLYYSPAQLMEQSPFWGNAPELAYRDYGAKIFFRIGPGDVVTVPTAANVYLFNWSENIALFIGMDYNERALAPAAFPVEVSEDCRTMTIKQYESGSEFNFGTYRPSVMFGSSMWNVATSDIVLRKVD